MRVSISSFFDMPVVRNVPAHTAVDEKHIPWSQLLLRRLIGDPFCNRLQAIYNDRHAPIKLHVGPRQTIETEVSLSIRPPSQPNVRVTRIAL